MFIPQQTLIFILAITCLSLGVIIAAVSDTRNRFCFFLEVTLIIIGIIILMQMAYDHNLFRSLIKKLHILLEA